MDGTAERLETARLFAIEAARLASNTRCHHVVVLDVSRVSPVTDFFVIASGTSPRQMRTVAEDIAEIADAHQHEALATNGLDGESWVLIDFVDVIVHIFSDQARQYYDLDNLWGDGKRVNWRP